MNPRISFSYALFSAALLLASTARAQQDLNLDTFDTEDEAARWTRWWGAADQTYEFDAATDANSNSASGSLKGTIGFDLASHAGDNQFAVIGSFADNATLDGTQYTNLVFDLKWDPA